MKKQNTKSPNVQRTMFKAGSMKRITYNVLTIPLLVLLFVAATSRPVHIFMAGDSTMANKVTYRSMTDSVTGEKVSDYWPERGWGQVLPEFFTQKVAIDNRAKNGRSTKTFIEEGLWDALIKDVRRGDYVVIQFGHNDEVPTKKSYTPPADYVKNLKRFVDEVREKRATPILCTPASRRSFVNGKIEDTHAEYAALVRKVANEKKVTMIDMDEKSINLLNKLGEKESMKLFIHIPAGTNKLAAKGLVDNTHFREAGAKAMASIFVQEIKEEKLSVLTKELKENVAPYVSQVWTPDLGNGYYKNPVLYADYSDPDVCRKGDDFYMTASSFNCVPGLPILHSNDLVNWTIISYAIQRLTPVKDFNYPQHGNGVWAPAIRYHDSEFYIYYGDPDQGIFMTKAKDPAGEWSPLVLVKEGKGLIDSCPFWDEDGQCYLAHGVAGSRFGLKSVLSITRMSPDGMQAIGDSKIIYDGHDLDPTIEGPKMYKRNGYYYIFAPAGGVATGWQLVLRSKNIWGPYERKVVMAQGSTKINGPHQGAWVDTPSGEDWFLHFQDQFAYGRVVHLQPMKWINDWPVIGEDPDGDGCGQPVLTYKKPKVKAKTEVANPAESDEFNTNTLGLQWQWHANPQEGWYFTNEEKGYLSLYSVQAPDSGKKLWQVSNLLLQKTPSNEFAATMKLNFKPNDKLVGERTGLVMMGLDYALLSLEKTKKGLVLSQNVCKNADKDGSEKTNASVSIPDGDIYLRVKVESDATCAFFYSLDGYNYTPLGSKFTMKEGKWIGAKIGTFCTRPVSNNDGGRVDIDWFRVESLVPAFPGAEGAGMYTTGGRGGNVYFVTSLEDTILGDKKLREGTLRWCVRQPGPRTILFRVAGIIHLKEDLEIKENTSLLGQSAPGDGICIAGNTVSVKGDNVIIRYMRFRMGDQEKAQEDALSGVRCKNVIIDHCSMSWSTDECSSFYDNEDFTMQWCILSESLRTSVHAKGSHGYGGIWGGHTASFHHNLLAHHDSRNPRMCGTRYSARPDLERVDFRNNVIYNWGSNSGYAGEGGSFNFVNNYYKPGAASVVKNRIFQPNADAGDNRQAAGVWGTFYVNGNVVEGYPDVNADNWLGIHPNPMTKDKKEIRADKEFLMPSVTTDSAKDAFDKVMAQAGASYKRDKTDTRIITETREGLAPMRSSKSTDKKPGLIDTQNDVGGWDTYTFDPASLPADSNRDGIPDAWLETNYPGKTAVDINEDGYTYLEVYLNSLVK